MTAPLVLTRDETLLEEVLRLCAAAGVTPEVAADPGAALASWAAAPLVLVGADLAEEAGALRPARRDGVHVLAPGSVADTLFVAALGVGAETVTSLATSGTWLVELLTDAGDAAPTHGRVVGVLGACGGAGASVLACALGQVAAREGRALVIDADPAGAGLDRVLGLESEPGVRWDAIEQTTGRLSARSLRDAVPAREGVGVLTWRPGAAGSLQAFAVREALSAARRGHEVVVVDLPRGPGSLVLEVLGRCDDVVAVTRPDLLGVAGATRTLAGLAPHVDRLVVRGSGGVSLSDIARVTGITEVLAMPDQRGLAEAVDLGLGPVRSGRGPLARTAADLLRHLDPLGRAA